MSGNLKDSRSSFIALNGFIYCHMNALSIAPHIDHIRKILRNIPFHVIAISESWLNVKQTTSSFEIPCFKYIRKDRGDGRRAGGVMNE
jgi:hypothetical protein